MTDYMTREEYKDACRYRVRETLENLLKKWDPKKDEEIVNTKLITETLAMLDNTVDELKYFREKLETTDEESKERIYEPISF
jgi:oligoribonuclease (3'-5' exoribonuclease)